MYDHQTNCRRRSRLVLLLAGLLYLFGAAADPIVHGLSASAPAGALVFDGGTPPGPGEAEPLPGHDDGPCLLCKVAGAVSLLSAGAALAPADAPARPVALPAAGPRGPPLFPSAQPRAPPSV